MTAAELLERLRGLDVEVWSEGERIRLRAPRGALSDELKHELAERKQEILSFLRAASAVAAPTTTVVAVQPNGDRAPLFAVPGHNGDVFCFVHLARHLGADQPFFALQPPGVDGCRPPLDGIEELGAHFAGALRAFGPGPYAIAGFCVGGSIAFETARQLVLAGERVRLLALLGAAHPAGLRRTGGLSGSIGAVAGRLRRHAALLRREPLAQLRHLAQVAPERVLHGAARRAVERATMAAVRRYAPGSFAGRVTLFLPNEAWARTPDRPLDWSASAAGGADTVAGPPDCDGDNMLREPHVRWLAAELRARLERAAKGAAS